MADTQAGGQIGASPHATAKREPPTLAPQAWLARHPRRVLGRVRAANSSGRALSQRRTSGHAAPDHLQWHPVCTANGLPMEDAATGIRFGFHSPRPLPILGTDGSLWSVVETLSTGIRRSQGYRMGVAGRRQCHRLGAGKGGDCIGKNPTDRGKLGTKRHVHVDRQGIPLAVTLSAANDHDKTQLQTVLDTRVVARPSPNRRRQHLCLDKGYDYRDIRLSVLRRGYSGHIPYRGEPPLTQKKYPARRWVVERTNRWHNLFRRLKIRYEVHAQNYLGFVQLACAIICFRRTRDR
jgi:putative transposase